MSPFGLVLALALTAPGLGAPADRPADAAPNAAEVDPNDPFALLALADAALQDRREDLAVAAWVSALRQPGTKARAAAALERHLLTSEPRAAWESASRELLASGLASNPHTLRVRHAEARLLSASTRGAATVDLTAMHQRDRDDVLVRNALGDGYLRSDRPEQALSTFRAGRAGAEVWKGEIAALLALGRYDEAVRAGGELVPGGCRTSPAPVPCALGLVQLGYPEAALASLRRAEDRARSPLDQAAYIATRARITASQDPTADTVRLWEQAVALNRADRTYQDALVAAYLLRRRPDAAARVVTDPRDPLQRTVQAVALVNGLNLNQRDPATLLALDRARELDGSHPIVVRAWAHHLIVSGEAAQALAVLDPYIENHAIDPEWLQLYIWAAGTAQQPQKAAQAVERALRGEKVSPRWQKLTADLATWAAISGDTAKREERVDRAIDQLRAAHALDPLTVAHLLALGGAYWTRGGPGDAQRAEQAFRMAVEAAPRNRAALTSLVSLLRAQGRPDEARRVLVASGYTDAAIRQLERELEMYALSEDARRLLDLGRPEQSVEAYGRLLALYPNEKVLLHGLADAQSAAGQPESAARTYGLARSQDPDDLWMALGEVRARIANAQANATDTAFATRELDRAEGVLRAFGEPEAREERAAWRATQGVLTRGRADVLAAAGDAEGAYALLRGALDDPERAPEADAELYAGLAGLYMSRWQYGAAQVYYEEALSLNPRMDEAERGIIRSLAARGDYEAAQERAGRLAARSPRPENTSLAQAVARQRAIDDAARHALNGDDLLAERILEEQRAAWPDALDVQVALVTLKLRAGDPDAAFDMAAQILKAEPSHPGALSALQTAALRTHRADEALPFYQAAVAASPEPWLKGEVRALELAAALDAARDLHAQGRSADAARAVEDAARTWGDATARHQAQLGAAWMDLGYTDRATAAFATARHLDPSDVGGTVGMAAALRARGQAIEARNLLRDAWEERHQLEVGLALAELQAAMGQHVPARRTLDEVAERTQRGGVRTGSSAPDPLPVRPVPSGAAVPEDEDQRPPDVPVSLPQADTRALQEEASDPYRVGFSAGVGAAVRPGTAGSNYIGLVYAPVAAEVAVWRALRLQAEVVPLQVNDGRTTRSATSASGGFAAGIGEALYASARVGTSPRGPEVPTDPYLTWSGVAAGRVADTLSAELETVRAPVTDSMQAFLGADDPRGGGDYGRLHDTWVGAKIARSWPNDARLGAIGRWGQTTGLRLAPGGVGEGMVPWEQALAFGRVPLRQKLDRSLWLGAEAMLLDHDRQVDAFGPGGGGVFSPDLFYSGTLRLEGLVGATEDERFTACGVVGLGPQVVVGEPTLYLNPGTYLGYELKGSMAWNLADRWALVGHVSHGGSWAVWGQTAGLVTLRFGKPESSLSPVSPAVASMAHGPPLLEPGNCGVDWKNEEAAR
jgi:Tfp pilus assembly protein PilF